MTRQIGLRVLKATIPKIKIIPKIKKTTPPPPPPPLPSDTFLFFSTIYGIGYVSTFVGYFIIRPDYNPSYSFRRNAYNEITGALLAAAIWPGLIPLMANKYITEIIEEDPIKPDSNHV
jgi:hypothetical protein